MSDTTISPAAAGPPARARFTAASWFGIIAGGIGTAGTVLGGAGYLLGWVSVGALDRAHLDDLWKAREGWVSSAELTRQLGTLKDDLSREARDRGESDARQAADLAQGRLNRQREEGQISERLGHLEGTVGDMRQDLAAIRGWLDGQSGATPRSRRQSDPAPMRQPAMAVQIRSVE